MKTPTMLAGTLWLGAALAAASAPKPAGSRVFEDVPAQVDASARYLIYVHGRILELQGRSAVSPDFGAYQYDAILRAFAERGFNVISEVRKGDAGLPFARKVADQVRSLEAKGVPARSITVVGASKGGFLTLATAAELGDPGVSFVVLAGCGPQSVPLAPRLKGRVLSIYDSKDRFTPSCEETFRKAPGLGQHKEIVVKLGLDHGLLYRPLPEWVTPAVDWALGK